MVSLLVLSTKFYYSFNLSFSGILIFQVFPLWWINWLVHLWLLLVLLLCTIRYEWFHADLLLLWIHGMHLLWFLSHAWYCWFPSITIFCSSYISLNQVRVRRKLGMLQVRESDLNISLGSKSTLLVLHSANTCINYNVMMWELLLFVFHYSLKSLCFTSYRIFQILVLSFLVVSVI